MTEIILKGFGKMNEYEWNNPVEDWDSYRINDYFDWVKGTYGKGEIDKGFIHADSYRAVMDVKQSIKEPIIDKQPTQILTSKAIAAQALKILEEELTKSYEYNKP